MDLSLNGAFGGSPGDIASGIRRFLATDLDYIHGPTRVTDECAFIELLFDQAGLPLTIMDLACRMNVDKREIESQILGNATN